MLMEGTVSGRFSWPRRCVLAMVGVFVLSLPITTLRAEPASGTSGADAADRTQSADAPAPDVASAPPAPENKSPQKPASGERVRDVDVESSLADFRQTAKHNLELSQTNFARRSAAERQFEAVKAAFEAETTSLDQVLEAQRRLAEARVSYARSASELGEDPVKREYVFALAALQASNQALNDARRIWKQVHRTYVEGEPGAMESQHEAQAREQYFQFKSQTQLLLGSYLKAKEAWAARTTPDGTR
jgi:hypothetical protein